MKGSEFVQTYKKTSLAKWEAAALELARQGSTVAWPMVALKLEADGHTATLKVASDYFAIGTPEDFVRLPLTPRTAQTIANLSGELLPTPKLVSDIHKQASVQLTPSPMSNRGANLEDYAAHSAKIETLRASRVGLVSGTKKDVVISNLAKAGKVLIYGWFWPEGVKPGGGFSNPIQPRSNVHGDFYVDYSHGIRFVSPVMTVDGEDMMTEAVLRDPKLSKLVSDEGPVRQVRYPADNAPAPYRPHTSAEYRASYDVYPVSRTVSLSDQGLGQLLAMAEKK